MHGTYFSPTGRVRGTEPAHPRAQALGLEGEDHGGEHNGGHCEPTWSVPPDPFSVSFGLPSSPVR